MHKNKLNKYFLSFIWMKAEISRKWKFHLGDSYCKLWKTYSHGDKTLKRISPESEWSQTFSEASSDHLSHIQVILRFSCEYGWVGDKLNFIAYFWSKNPILHWTCTMEQYNFELYRAEHMLSMQDFLKFMIENIIYFSLKLIWESKMQR